MTADVEMLPLPEPKGDVAGGGLDWTDEEMQDHARAVAEHNVKERDAEIEALRAEVDRWKSNYNAAIELKGQAFAESDRLAEALRECINFLPDRGVPGMHKDTARAALRDHDQEGKDG